MGLVFAAMPQAGWHSAAAFCMITQLMQCIQFINLFSRLITQSFQLKFSSCHQVTIFFFFFLFLYKLNFILENQFTHISPSCGSLSYCGAKSLQQYGVKTFKQNIGHHFLIFEAQELLDGKGTSWMPQAHHVVPFYTVVRIFVTMWCEHLLNRILATTFQSLKHKIFWIGRAHHGCPRSLLSRCFDDPTNKLGNG